MTAAYQLSKKLGDQLSQLDVYELGEQVGGLSRTLDLWDQKVDLGPHRFFSRDPRINSLWLEVVRDQYDIVNRQTRIYYNQRFFDYPIRAFNALKGLGILEAFRCVLSYILERLSPTRDTSTFEGWVTSRFGKRLYAIFFKTYTERLWGIPCTELDSDFAAQRIKKLNLFEAIKNALLQGKGKQHATLVDQFAYPLGGTGSVYLSMQSMIEARGGKVWLRTGVKKVLTREGQLRALELEDGLEVEYDHIISTMPISLLVERLPEVPAEVKASAQKLRFRNTLLVYLEIGESDLFTDQWLYIHDPSVSFGRVSNFRNWVPELCGKQQSTILCLEYWCNFGDALWELEEEELVELATREIVVSGLAPEGSVLRGKVVRLPRCYPVYFMGYREAMAPVESYLSSIPGLHVIGRYGAYKYNNQDHSMLMGMRVAENILDHAGHELWEINTDYEVYQESSIITKTGLVAQEVPQND